MGRRGEGTENGLRVAVVAEPTEGCRNPIVIKKKDGDVLRPAVVRLPCEQHSR